MKKILILLVMLLFLQACTPVENPTDSKTVTKEVTWHKVSPKGSIEGENYVYDDTEVFNSLRHNLDTLDSGS